MSLPLTDLDAPPTIDPPLVRRRIRCSGLDLEIVADERDRYFQAKSGDPRQTEVAIEVMHAVLAPEATVLDVGSCLGIVTLAATSLAPQGRVVAVEPNPAVLPGLRATLHPHRERVDLVVAAVGSAAGSTFYKIDEHGSAWGHATDDPLGPEVPQISLDQLVDGLGLDRVDMVKIDVEGRELDVLRGAVALVERDAPVMVVELNPFCLWRYGRTLPQDLVDWMCDHYAHVVAIDDDGTVIDLASQEARDQVLASTGTTGGLVDLVASPTPLPEIRRVPPAPADTTDGEADRPEAAAGSAPESTRQTASRAGSFVGRVVRRGRRALRR